MEEAILRELREIRKLLEWQKHYMLVRTRNAHRTVKKDHDRWLADNMALIEKASHVQLDTYRQVQAEHEAQYHPLKATLHTKAN